jgi:hypothetical protein
MLREKLAVQYDQSNALAGMPSYIAVVPITTAVASRKLYIRGDIDRYCKLASRTRSSPSWRLINLPFFSMCRSFTGREPPVTSDRAARLPSV